MRKLTRKNLDELVVLMPVISEIQQRSYFGGGNGSIEDPYTFQEYNYILTSGFWNGGWVESYYVNMDGTSGLYPPSSSGYYDESGNNVSGIDTISPQYMLNQMTWDSTKPTFINQASFIFGIDISNINFIVATGSRNAWLGDNNEVFLGDSFFNLSSKNQFRVLCHEYIHVTEDLPWNKTTKNIQTTLPEPPADIKPYVLEKYCGNNESELNGFLTYSTLRDPQYYKNEANAYIKEKSMFSDLTGLDLEELNYRIWYYTEMARNAEIFY